MLRRSCEGLLAALLIVALSPGFIVVLVLAMLDGGGIRKQERLGRWATRFNQYGLAYPTWSSWSGFGLIEQIPALYNILKGEMSFVGPRPISPVEELTDRRIAWKRYDTRPGLLSLWWIRKRANIAYSSELSLDLEYVENKSLWGDLGIAARALPAALFATGAGNAPPQITFLGVQIDNLTMAEASVQIATLAKASNPVQVCFVNADCVNIAYTDHSYRATLAKAQLVLADGIGVRIAAALLDQNVRENVNGTDMLPHLCNAIQQAELSIYLLGGKLGAAERTAEWIAHNYPNLTIAGYRDGYFTLEEQSQVISHIRDSEADVLLVGLGAPKQDQWIAEHRHQLGAKVLMGVGGLLDFYSGNIPRAPVWVRELGMEWFFRFVQEPRRMWRRYFVGNALFLFRVLKERLRVRASQNKAGTIQ